MDIKSLIGIIELVAVFLLVIGFCWWQLRSLDKLDREDQEKAGQETKED
jgi:hypothetical protein